LFAVGPGGEAIGALAEVLPDAIGSGGDADWIAAVIAAIERELATRTPGRSQLLVIRATGTWFHATFAENRESITRAVELDRVWLEGDPGSDGGGGDNWMICPQPIAPSQLRLVEQDLDRKR
jgi:hypothetical protein